MGVQNGHQAYVESFLGDGGRAGLKVSYFRRTDPDGKLLRAVICRGYGSCEHYSRLDRYMLYYTAPSADFAKWEEMDRKLKSLVDSWIVP